jgi:hypothetical protein
VRAATLLSRPDGGHGGVLIARSKADTFPDAAALRDLERRLFRHGFDGHVRAEVKDLPDAVSEAELTQNPSFLVVDDAHFDVLPGPVPVLVILDGSLGADGTRLVAPVRDGEAVQGEVARRLARSSPTSFSLRRTFLPGGAKS